MPTVGHLRCFAATGFLLGALSLGCSGSGSGSSAKPDAFPSGSGGQVGTSTGPGGATSSGGATNPGGAGAAGNIAAGGTAGSGAGNQAGSTAPPQDGGTGGATDAAQDGNLDRANDLPAGGNDAGVVDGRLDGQNPDGTGDAPRDRIPDTRDSAVVPKDTAPDGSTPCGACLSGLTCGGGGVADQCGVTIAPQHGRDCSMAGWCYEVDRPILSAIYARTPDDIWAVGRAGQIAHFDGSVWTITSGVIQSRGFAKALSSSALDQSGNDSDFTSVWASGPSDIWVTARVPDPTNKTSLTYLSLLLRGNGTHWNVVLKSTDPTLTYVGIWGTGPDDVWLAQRKFRQDNSVPVVPSVAHWDGASWTTHTTPDLYDNTIPNCGELNAITGLSPNEIYLSCSTYLWRFDRTTWTGFPQRAQAVWGTSSSSLWVATATQLFHKVGATWIQMTTPDFCGTGVWGVSDSSLWFGGCYYDGLKWTYVYPALKVVHGPTATGALGLNADGDLISLTATSATALSASSPAIFANDIAGSGPKDVWIVGVKPGTNGKARALHWDGSTFQVIDQTSPDAFTNVAVLPDNDVWAGASTGLWRWSGTNFVASTGSPKGTRQQLWSPSKDAIWAVTGSDAAIWYFDGTTWQKLPHGLNATTIKLATVWGSGPSDIWVAGSTGMTEHWNGTAWTAYDAGIMNLVRVWGASPTEVFVVSEDDKIYAWDGSRWALSSTVPLEKSSILDYRVCAANDIWASLATQYSGYAVPELAHFDGSAWHTYTPGELEQLYGRARVFCAAPGDVWMVQEGSNIRHLQTP